MENTEREWLEQAGENLLIAVQALSSDAVPEARARKLALGQSLPAILEHSVSLPAQISNSLRATSQAAEGLTRSELAGRLTAVLREINHLLSEGPETQQETAA